MISYRKRLRVLIVAPPFSPVPPYAGYGGTQRGIYDLCLGLSHNGHQVYLIAPSASTINLPNVILIPFKTRSPWDDQIENADFLLTHDIDRQQIAEKQKISREIRGKYAEFVLKETQELVNHKKIDIINVRYEYVLETLTKSKAVIPIVVSYHSIVKNLSDIAKKDGVYVTVHTQAMFDVIDYKKNVSVIPYGIRTDHIPFSEVTLADPAVEMKSINLKKLQMLKIKHKDYVLFLGSIIRWKSPGTAIKIAKEAGLPIIIAGTPQVKAESAYDITVGYFKNEIEPYIDGDSVIYYGNANEEEKYLLMKYAKCTIFPSGFEDNRWTDSFGRVVAESLATGTPVLVANTAGGALEQITPGLHGFTFSSLTEAVVNLKKIDIIDRKECRKHALEKLSSKRFVLETENLFYKLISNNKDS